MALRLLRVAPYIRSISGISVRSMSQTGEWGEGAGKGGGAGGSIREGGGAFGKMEAAREEEYFRKLQKEQLAKIRKTVSEEIEFHKDQIEEHKTLQQLEHLHDQHQEEILEHNKAIKRHEESIDRHKERIKQLKDMETH